jgi:hypothetical protein
VLEDVLHYGAEKILQQGAAAAGSGGDAEMAEAGAAPAAAAAAAAPAEYSEEQVQQLLMANPAQLLAAAAAPAAEPADGAAQQQQGAAAPVSCSFGPAGSGLELVTVVDLSGIKSEVEEGPELEEGGEGEESLDTEDGTGGALAAAAAGGNGEAEASRAQAAAAAARQWEALLHDSWQELQREEEAAQRAAGHDADGPDEAVNDTDADDVSAGLGALSLADCDWLLLAFALPLRVPPSACRHAPSHLLNPGLLLSIAGGLWCPAHLLPCHWALCRL